MRRERIETFVPAEVSRRLMQPVTQQFRDRSLEKDYRMSMRQQTMRGVRMGVLLAILLFGLFGAIDVLLGVERLAFTLTMRAAIIVFACLLFVSSFQPAFNEHREQLLLVFCLAMGFTLAAIMTAVDEPVADRYYVGFVLIVMASYLIMGISFASASVVAGTNIALCLLTERLFHPPLDLGTLTNLAFLVSAALIAAVGAYSLGRQRRLAWYRGLLLERAHSESRHSALHDVLTGLPNRRLLMEKLAQAVARDRRFGNHAAVVFLDLDGFKKLNDHHGHAGGDLLLKTVALRLNDAVRATDTVARIGGDEFVVLFEDLASPDQADVLVNRLVSAFDEPVEVGSEQVFIRFSLGVALHPDDGNDAFELLEYADQAMYREKRERRRPE